MNNKFNVVVSVLLVSIITGMVYLWATRPQIVYVKTDYLLEKYEGMVEARSTFKSKADEWQTNVDTLKFTLENTIKEYELMKGEMPKAERTKKENFIRAKQKDLMTYSQAIEQKAREEDQKLTSEVVTNVNEFLKEYGKKKGYDAILGANGSGNIIYGKETAMDITEEVLAELNDWYEGT